LALLVFAPLLAAKAINAPRFALELRIGAGLLLLNTLNGPQTAVLSGLEAFKAIAQVNSIRGVLSVPLIIGGLLIGRIQGALWGLVVAACIGWLLNHLAIKRECRRNRVPVSYRGANSEWRALWSFSIPAFLQSAMVAPVSWVAASYLVTQAGGFSELGLFNAANQLRTLLMFLPQILSGVALPILTSLFADARRTNGKEMDLYHLFNQAIAWPMVAAILLSSRWILSLYGPEFRGGEMAMLLVVGTAGVCVIGQTMGTILWAKGKVWFGLAANTLWALILLLIVWRTVPAMGALGLALAYLVAYVFLLLIQALYLNMKGIVSADFALRNVCSALGIILLLTTATHWVQALPHSLAAIATLTCTSLAALYFGVGRDMRDTIAAFLLAAKPLDKPGLY
jgi:O-antigen/teichoic acid export membrane protein